MNDAGRLTYNSSTNKYDTVLPTFNKDNNNNTNEIEGNN